MDILVKNTSMRLKMAISTIASGYQVNNNHNRNPNHHFNIGSKDSAMKNIEKGGIKRPVVIL